MFSVSFSPTVSRPGLRHGVSEGEDPQVTGRARQARGAAAAEPEPPDAADDRYDGRDEAFRAAQEAPPTPSSAACCVTRVPTSSHQLSLSDAFPLWPPPLFLPQSFSPSLWLFLDLEEEEDLAFFADLTHFARFTTDPDFCYQEFARREDDHFQVFRVQVSCACVPVIGLVPHVSDDASSLLLSPGSLISRKIY